MRTQFSRIVAVVAFFMVQGDQCSPVEVIADDIDLRRDFTSKS